MVPKATTVQNENDMDCAEVERTRAFVTLSRHVVVSNVLLP